MTVFQYRLEILGMKVWDANLVQKIIRFKRSALEKALGLYVPSGEQIYMLTELDEDVKFDVTMQGNKYTILIKQSTQSVVTMDGKFENQDNSVNQNLINIIIKQAFRETDLKQIGKTPRFFDLKQMQDIKKSQLRILSGFKASALQTQVGCTLVVDSIFKFMSTTTCLERIVQLKDECYNLSQHQF